MDTVRTHPATGAMSHRYGYHRRVVTLRRFEKRGNWPGPGAPGTSETHVTSGTSDTASREWGRPAASGGAVVGVGGPAASGGCRGGCRGGRRLRGGASLPAG